MKSSTQILTGFITGVLILIFGASWIVKAEEKRTAMPIWLAEYFSGSTEGRAAGSHVTELSQSDKDLSQSVSENQASPAKIVLSGGIHDNWLKIERSNLKAHDAKGFDPAYVTATSFLKPVSKKVGNKWETHWETDL